MSALQPGYTVRFPDYFEDVAWEVVSKGYFVGVTVEYLGQIFEPAFYDPTRLSQEILDELNTSQSFFADKNLVVIETVDSEHILAAVEGLAERGFDQLVPTAR